MPKKRLAEKGYSNKQVKQTVHGTFVVAEFSGSLLVLTPLGEKVGKIQSILRITIPVKLDRWDVDGY
jgi:hypothetical protein